MKVGRMEHRLTQMCFEAERAAGKAYRDGNMEKYHELRGKYEAYRDAAQIAEKMGV